MMLSTHVVFQMTRCTKSFIAHITLVRLLVRVNTHVDFQITDSRKRSRTHHTRTVSRSCEYACGFQITRSMKALLAHITFVRFLVRVNTHVAFQITRITKTLLAHITFIRPLVRVNTHVGFQSTRITKKLSRTHHIRTASRSCEYACDFSNYKSVRKRFSHTSHSYGFSFV